MAINSTAQRIKRIWYIIAEVCWMYWGLYNITAQSAGWVSIVRSRGGYPSTTRLCNIYGKPRTTTMSCLMVHIFSHINFDRAAGREWLIMREKSRVWRHGQDSTVQDRPGNSVHEPKTVKIPYSWISVSNDYWNISGGPLPLTNIELFEHTCLISTKKGSILPDGRPESSLNRYSWSFPCSEMYAFMQMTNERAFPRCKVSLDERLRKVFGRIFLCRKCTFGNLDLLPFACNCPREKWRLLTARSLKRYVC